MFTKLKSTSNNFEDVDLVQIYVLSAITGSRSSCYHPLLLFLYVQRLMEERNSLKEMVEEMRCTQTQASGEYSRCFQIHPSIHLFASSNMAHITEKLQKKTDRKEQCKK